MSWNKGKETPIEVRRKISKSVSIMLLEAYKNGTRKSIKGKVFSEEDKNKRAEKRKGKRNSNYGKSLSLEHIRKLSEVKKGKPSNRKGKKCSIEHRQKLSMSHIGKTPWNKGKLFKAISGSNHYNWHGGSSFESHGLAFNKQLKNRIKELYGNKCVLCGREKRICIHHIDYCKQNNNEYNLIPLCTPHHNQTNHNREKWEKELTQIVHKKQVDFICNIR